MSGSQQNGVPYVGYRRPPEHTRFQKGVSGNPSGRPKGGQNLKTILDRILKEQVSLREGAKVRKVSKAEALLRGMVVGAMKGDPRSVAALMKVAEQTGQFEGDEDSEKVNVQIVRFAWEATDSDQARSPSFPAITHINRE